MIGRLAVINLGSNYVLLQQVRVSGESIFDGKAEKAAARTSCSERFSDVSRCNVNFLT